MKLASSRPLEGMKPVLRNPESTGPDPVYWVFNQATEGEWENVTIITSGTYNNELPKTYGHYHPDNAVDETYHLLEGEGVLQMQKKHIENGQLVPEKVDEVYLIKANPGDEIVIKNYFGHSWSNVGEGPLISFDNWRSGHDPSDYQPIEKMQGMAYYLVKDEDEIKAVPNPKYQDLPEPKWVSAEEFAKLNP